MTHHIPFRTQQARFLRHNMPTPERTFWNAVRRKGVGLKFRRQHPIGPYVLDFYIPELHVAIELDGITHESLKAHQHDERRTHFLQTQGITVIRFPNQEVMQNTEGVIDHLQQKLASLHRDHPLPNPPHYHGEGTRISPSQSREKGSLPVIVEERIREGEKGEKGERVPSL